MTRLAQVVLLITGGVLTFAFTVQKQQLEETRLFKVLFEEFNARYDAMNDELIEICEQSTDLPLTKSEIKNYSDTSIFVAKNFSISKKASFTQRFGRHGKTV